MPKPKKTSALVRQWKLIELLRGHKRGLTCRQILARLGSSKATFYRDLYTLREAGIPLASETQNGEARHTLYGHDLPPLGPTLSQLSALRLAQHALLGLAGSKAARELDALLASYPSARGLTLPISVARATPQPPELVRALDHAIDSQRKLRIRYRSTSARKPDWRTVDPLGMRYARGQLYFVAYDDKRRTIVPFKLDRLSQVEPLKERAAVHAYDPEALFAHSAKIWTGPTHEVAVLLDAAVARFAREYPLVPDQAIEDQAGGAVIVRATVSGLPEALRWLLSWGRAAEALSPPELRALVADEVSGAAERYATPKVHAFAAGD